MVIERITFPNGVILDSSKCLSEQIDQIVRDNLSEVVVLASGRHRLYIPLLSEAERPFIIVNRNGDGVCFAVGYCRDKNGIRMPGDRISYSLTSMVVPRNRYFNDPKLKLFEHLFYTPGPSPK